MSVTFLTDRGVPVPALTAAEMREVDRIAVEETGPTLFQMMENAGRSVAQVTLSRLSDRLSDRRTRAEVVVLAGTGGNGGGGIAAGRHLANRGVPVTAVVTDVTRLTPVPSAQLAVFRHAGGAVFDAARDGGDLSALVSGAALIIDAVIGYGLRSAPHGAAARLIEVANEPAAPVLALDVPSGIDATSGETPGMAVRADITVTLALPKTGLVARGVGELFLADIGIPSEVYARLGKPLVAPVFDERWIVPLVDGTVPV